MRSLCLFLLLPFAALAAPGPASPPTGDKPDPSRFASSVQHLLDQIADSYVMPLPRERLYEAALAGVCQAARRPMPRGIASDLRKALAKDAPAGSVEAVLSRFVEAMGKDLAPDALLVAARAAAVLLDPHSGLVTAEEQRRTAGLDSESVGLGIERDGAVVESVLPGSPAQRAGLRPGDLLVSVNGEGMAKLRPALAMALKSERAPLVVRMGEEP
ncbi:MAG: PDZ domain-containing protein, partial [Gemmataceae bacterium]|nr:PDZ domain-containing protein [Gemmataceae bacterium]